ncbi:TPA: hypothetical protein HA242_03790 [Candidatus Woesearchaeota archaeon]|nr:hypothetical protein [Candidatus Woesearchaeota archaeon]HIG93214.1 hypothetical protein [Candidatus Woesearchaeota archaeon]HIH12818.1 hypothetical protein [Candidatus Woesearchaeota archaeon]
MNKKGMEMWQLIFILLAVLLFLFMLIWFGILNKDLAGLFDKLGGML